MILFLRVFLIGLIFYLIFRSFSLFAGNSDKSSGTPEKAKNSKHISKKTGEYIDYEETDK
ncbi:MAG TPA: hypothetical protein VFB97_01465 [Bacteroidales bacterium]|jgi:hypothetical protein|nr:hypothetical protein [Bacteroidales bacterium]